MVDKSLITGANRGIGFEMSKQLGLKNYFVVLGARSLAKGKDACAQLVQAGVPAERLDVVRLDLDDTNSISAAFKQVKQKHPDLNYLINNAGIAGQMGKSALETTAADYRQTLETNFFGTLAVIQNFLPLLQQNHGKIAAITGPFSATKWYNPAAYRVSKIALNALLQTLAVDISNQKLPLSVFGIFPGGVSTEINAYRQGSYMKDVATAAHDILKIILDGQDHNGQIIGADGQVLSGISD